MAAALLHSTTEEANYQRIARLVIIRGTALLREIFDNRCPPSNLPKILQDPVVAKQLKGLLLRPQWNSLYPSPVMYGESKDFNLTLLFKLLTAICNITPPATGWYDLPTYTDHSLAAELVRVKYYRNVVCHQGIKKISDDEFLSLWKEISDSLLRLARQISPEKIIELQEVIHNSLTNPVITTEEANYQRIARLLIIGGTALLREIFDNRCPPSHLPKILQDPDTMKRLRGARLCNPQWDSLYPRPGVYGESKDFGVNLLFKLLTTICNITPPTTGWYACPAYTDHSLAAEIARINYCNNVVYGHMNQSMMKITDDEFLSLWKEISDSILRLAGQISHEKKIEWQEVIQKLLMGPVVLEEEKNLQMSEQTASTQVFSLETAFHEKAQGIKDLLREELESIAQGVQVVKHLGLGGVKKGQEETIRIAETPVREEFQIKDRPKEVLQSARNLTSSAGGSQVGAARLRLYIDCEIISGPGLRAGSSKEDKKPEEDVQGLSEESATTVAIKEVPGIKDVLEEEETTIIEGVQKGVEHLGLKETQTTVTVAPEDSTDIENQPEKKFQGTDRLRLTAGYAEAAASRLQMCIDCETITELALSGESSQAFLAEVMDARLEPSLPTAQEVDAHQGSVIITLECATLEILEGLWEDYNTGHMKEVVQKRLVTDDIIEEFGEVKLTITISEEEYKACRDFFSQGSDESNVEWSTTGKRKNPVSTLHSLDSKRMKIVNYTVSTSQEAVSEDAVETETGSMDQVETASKAKSEPSLDRLETASEFLSENRMETALDVESDRIAPYRIIQNCRWEISPKGGIWKLQDIQAAACITFPRNAVTKPVLFRCTLRQSTTNFPPLKKDEALVSSVIALTYDDPLGSNFTGDFVKEVTVALSHSACNLKGYEVVIRELVDSDNNEWRDLETTNMWQASDIQDDPSSKPEIPFAEAKVKCCSAFAVICRLKSYTYSTPADDNCDFTCIVHEFPDVSVSIPASVVHEHKEFQLTLKVQEILSQWFEESEMIVGPVLHITCSHKFELLEPATITIPILLQADKKEFSEFSPNNVKVLVHSDEDKSDWKEITHQLRKPADLTNGVVRFQVTHFSKWHVVHFRERPKRAWQKSGVRKLPPWYKPNTKIVRKAGFFACLCSTDSPGSDQFLLKLCCYPIHMKSRVKKEMHSEYRVLLHGAGNSIEQLCEGDDVRVATLNGLKAKKDFILRFIGVENYEDGAAVKRDPRCAVPEISFVKYIRGKRTIRLCELTLAPPALTTTTQRLTAEVEDGTLFDLSQKLGSWKPLGRQLEIDDSKLTKFDQENDELEEKAYQMLLHWKRRDASGATYPVLYNALCNVARKDLAEKLPC